MNEQQRVEKFGKHIRSIDDFPSPGIRFYDISPLIGSGAVFSSLVHEMAEPLRDKVTKIVGFDARGFIFGGAMAAELGVGFVALRKAGKLPGDTHRVSYGLEYGTDELEIQTDVIDDGEKVALVDDIIATGGTALAGIELVRKCGGDVVSFCAVIDLIHLGGSARIEDSGVDVNSVMTYSEVV